MIVARNTNNILIMKSVGLIPICENNVLIIGFVSYMEENFRQ